MPRMSVPFSEWFNSDENPFKNASDSVKYSTFDALKAAFSAGERFGETKARIVTRNKQEKIKFEFDHG